VAIGAVTAASFLPWIIFSPVAGVIADRSDRRWLIAASQLGRGLAVVGFAWLVAGGNQSLVDLYAIALLIGAGEVLVDSATQAAIPMVAPRGQLRGLVITISLVNLAATAASSLLALEQHGS
jgi:MFS family permease